MQSPPRQTPQHWKRESSSKPSRSVWGTEDPIKRGWGIHRKLSLYPRRTLHQLEEGHSIKPTATSAFLSDLGNILRTTSVSKIPKSNIPVLLSRSHDRI